MCPLTLDDVWDPSKYNDEEGDEIFHESTLDNQDTVETTDDISQSSFADPVIINNTTTQITSHEKTNKIQAVPSDNDEDRKPAAITSSKKKQNNQDTVTPLDPMCHLNEQQLENEFFGAVEKMSDQEIYGKALHIDFDSQNEVFVRSS